MTTTDNSTPATKSRQNTSDEIISTVIPYKNKRALLAYYIGVFSIIPVAGLVLAPLSLFFGIGGLKDYKKNKNAKGKLHAWFGIIAGILFTLIHYGILILLLWDILLTSPH